MSDVHPRPRIFPVPSDLIPGHEGRVRDLENLGRAIERGIDNFRQNAGNMVDAVRGIDRGAPVSTATQAQNAQKKADKKAGSATAATACVGCSHPCAHLKCGVPGSRYRGGSHGCVSIPNNKLGQSGSLHGHHMPADKYSPIPTNTAPAIQMERADHYNTAAYGQKVHGPSYSAQRALLAKGKSYSAFLLDVADAKRVAAASGNPSKYDAAIAQATLYAQCLKKHGLMS